MRKGKKKAKRPFKYKGNAKAREVGFSMMILDMIIELGERPVPSDLANALDRLMALQPGRIPQNVRVAIVGHLRKAPAGKRSITVERFLEKYHAAVRESEDLQRAFKKQGKKSPYDSANLVIGRKSGMGAKKLERVRTLYRKLFPSEDEG